MLQVYDLVHRVANLNASVLVTGESGTGKELIARAIHNLARAPVGRLLPSAAALSLKL